MRSRKSNVGSKKWKNKNHKPKEWYIQAYGTHGIPMWERVGRK